MATRQKQIEKTREAILNLNRAIEVLEEEKASATDLEPYRTNLAREQAKLARLTKDGK